MTPSCVMIWLCVTCPWYFGSYAIIHLLLWLTDCQNLLLIKIMQMYTYTLELWYVIIQTTISNIAHKRCLSGKFPIVKMPLFGIRARAALSCVGGKDVGGCGCYWRVQNCDMPAYTGNQQARSPPLSGNLTVKSHGTFVLYGCYTRPLLMIFYIIWSAILRRQMLFNT